LKLRPVTAALACAALACLCSGCASTKLDAESTPGHDTAQYHKVIVQVDVAERILFQDVPDRTLRSYAERAFALEFAERGAEAVTYTELFSPESDDVLHEPDPLPSSSSIDAKLLVTCTSRTEETVSGVDGELISFPTSRSFTTTDASFAVLLYDLETGKVAWTGFAEIEGASSLKTALLSLADRVSDDLVDRGIVVPRRVSR